MIIKPREYRICKTCGKRELVADEVHGCDQCGKELSQVDADVLELTNFRMDGDESVGTAYHLCSWICTLRKLRNIQSNYFVELPILRFDDVGGSINATALWQAIRQIAMEVA